MKVAAVIPHWNRKDLLGPLLANLREQRRPFDEIIVVDNGSSDGSADLAAAEGATVIRLPENLGFAAGVNRGIRAAGCEWIAILNNDVTLDPGWLEELSRAAQEHGVSFVSGKILSARDPKILDGTFDELGKSGCACRCGAGRPDGPYWNRGRAIRMAPMTAALFRRDLFGKIGFLDEIWGSYLEDVEFGLRCALAGVGGWYEPAAVAWHQGSATLGAWQNNTVQLLARNQMLLTKKHFGGKFRVARMAGQLLWGLVALKHGTLAGYLSGKWQGWKQPVPRVPAETGQLERVLAEGERQILEIQRQTGFDAYWRAYFWLLPPS